LVKLAPASRPDAVALTKLCRDALAVVVTVAAAAAVARLARTGTQPGRQRRWSPSAEAAAGAISSPPPPAGLLLLFLLLKYLLMSTSMVASWMEQPSCALQLGDSLMRVGQRQGGVAGRGLPPCLARSLPLIDGLGADQRWFSCRPPWIPSFGFQLACLGASE
jgi:hypothetical protein